MDLARAIRAAARGEVVVSGTAVERLYSHLNGSADVVAFTGSRARGAPAARAGLDRPGDRGRPHDLGQDGGEARRLDPAQAGAQNRTQAVALARERVAG